MTMSYPLISSQYLEGFDETVIELGGDPLPLYKEAGLEPPAPSSKHTSFEAKLQPFDRHVKILDLARERLKRPDFALELANRQTIGVYGPIGMMAAYSETIGDALNLLAAHLPFTVQMMKLEIISTDNLVQYILRCDYESVAKSKSLQDHALAISYNLIQLLCAEPLVLRAAYLQHDGRENSSMYGRYFKCPVAFNHDFIGLAFQPQQLRQPIADTARTLPKQLRKYLEQRHKDSLLQQVRHVIQLMLPVGNCNLESVALAIGYSKRTLQRRLLEEKTSFQELIDEVRNNLSLDYLAHQHYRLTDVAAVLGYSELSAFTRSFKRWQGLSPQQWRQQQS